MDDEQRAIVTAWLAGFAERLGTTPPTDQELDELLELAGEAARAAARQAAPLACWLVARAGLTPAEARARIS